MAFTKSNPGEGFAGALNSSLLQGNDCSVTQNRAQNQRPTFHLTLVPAPGCANPVYQLRRGLKTLLRAHRLRAISVSVSMSEAPK
jgi:hypothetical protein